MAPPGPDRSGRLSARAFLLTNHDEPNGYGLYSYLLFATPPQDDQEHERYRRRSELNIMLLPIKRNIALPDNLSDPTQAAQAAQRSR